MNAADAATVRTVRRELSRRPIESTRVDIQVVNGHVSLTGIITRLRSQPTVSLQSELDTVVKIIMRERSVRDVSTQMRLQELQEQAPDGNEARARRRS